MAFLLLPGVYSTPFPGQRGFSRARSKFRCQNPLYQTVLILFLACGGQFLFGNKRQKFSPRHPFQPFTSLFLNGGNLPSVLLSGCHPRRGRDNRRDGRMPFRTGGRSGRGNCPNNDVAPQEIFRNRVRRAHPKPFRLRRGIAARGLHGNTARRLRDGRTRAVTLTVGRLLIGHLFGGAPSAAARPRALHPGCGPARRPARKATGSSGRPADRTSRHAGRSWI